MKGILSSAGSQDEMGHQMQRDNSLVVVLQSQPHCYHAVVTPTYAVNVLISWQKPPVQYNHSEWREKGNESTALQV